MLLDVNLPFLLLAALAVSLSPGPTTLALAGTSMASGRGAGLALAAGIAAGYLFWLFSAALGLGEVIPANAWIFEVLKYLGLVFFALLAVQAARSALSGRTDKTIAFAGDMPALFVKGFLLCITSPKVLLLFGSLFSVGVPPNIDSSDRLGITLVLGLQSFVVFFGLALLFSTNGMSAAYSKYRRWFEGVFAIGFGVAVLTILTHILQSQ